ncbi:MAG: LacI family DNA-binding transcriptional regulator [Peptostreptococcus stomatis]|uniref:LacI family DNA-binding transcriptional regulator n=1 Tax=Peptostreptococcus stomatis TaxID=341694 RepID=UPI001A63E3EA|nr:LacI family DNA-binding transcriptional regulator [Peptostreptococcus stomatis]MBL6465205.1 LacI family DNA-binding transcriptional regulator [Peptostreptococcus stomatis]
MEKQRKVTMQTVADEAGVSKATVSRAIGNYPDISDSTKKKIFEVMERLNYHPSAIARSLANRISKNVGLVLPADDDFFMNPFFQESLRGVAKTAGKRGYDTLIAYNGKNETNAIKRLVNSNKVDGVILMRSVIGDSTVNYLRDIEFPFILIGKSEEYDDIYTVDTDNVDACRKLTNHLVGLGCEKIGFIGGKRDSMVTTDRYDGYIQSIRENGLYFSDDMVEENEFNKLEGYMSMKKLLEANGDMDGVVITDSLIFSGAIDYLSSVCEEKDIIIGAFGAESNSFNKSKYKVVNIDVGSMKIGEFSCEKLIDILEKKDVDLTDIVDYKIEG